MRLERGSLFGLDLSGQRAYYYFCLGALAVVLAVVARLRRSGVGRRLIAVRDNPDCASAYTVSPARSKLTAFALAGAMAGLAGALLGALLRNIVLEDNLFGVSDSLDAVSIVVIGGLGSISGPVVGALWVKGLPAFWPDNELIPLLTSSIGMLVILLYFPGGLSQIGTTAREAALQWVDRRRQHEPSPPAAPPAPVSVRSQRNDSLPATVLRGSLERRQRAEAAELIGFLGLGRYADSFISDLSTGTRRIVGLANLLAVNARVLCLDEPTAGVAQREAEAFGLILKRIRHELGASMVVVEHDMPLIMSISDRMYCLESGSVIAVGEPAEIRTNPAVVASYLGTDERAINRSDSVAANDESHR